MHSVLRRLADVPGVRGSLVVTRDGIVVASHLSKALPEDLVAALASNVVHRAKRALEPLGMDGFRRVTLVASHGRMMFADTGPAFLVVVLDRSAELGPAGIEIDSAARRIRQQGEIRV